MSRPSKRALRPGWFARDKHGKAAKIGRPATEEDLRQLFNDNGILEKAASGELTVKDVKDGHPSPPAAKEPICTQSQLLAYLTLDGKKVAEAHQYLRPDGTVGASGRPDPKEVFHDGTLYYLDVR
jgi:hypothetical protein